MRPDFYRRRGKGLLDRALAAAGLAALSPVFALAALAIKMNDGGPVFFRQPRVGAGFRTFQMLKFRSMRTDAGGPPLTSSGDPRVTAVGRFLRRTKLDELPQLWNVLKGEMSLVGPRPEVPRFVEAFREDYEKILSVKPGITDFAAIEFRDEESVLAGFSDPAEGYLTEILPAKLRLYRRYVSELSLSVDLKILVRTLRRLAP
jgi:lipopolysaccharide/colanic/teichoic acid biosynthesis glycosyltransferase